MATDILVLGGGIIGCALADALARRGARVMLLERGRIGAEASTAAAGILASYMDLPTPGPLFELCQLARRHYPAWVRSLESRSKVDVGLHRDGILYLAMSGREADTMDRQVRWQLRRQLPIERWTPSEVRRREPVVDRQVTRGYFFAGESQVDNAAVMKALAVACAASGVVIREQTTVRRILVRRGAVQGVETAHGVVRARTVVNTLGTWASMDHASPMPLPVTPARGQMLLFRAAPGLVKRAVMSNRAYFVQRRDGRLLVGSTIEHGRAENALTIQGMHAILCGARRMSRVIDQCTFVDAWAGIRPYTRDVLPILGATSVVGLYAATGHFRHGILLAPTTAHLMTELILDGEPSWDLTPFSPQRF